MDEDWLTKKFEKEMELMKYLLKNASVLEEIIIYVNKREDFDGEKRRVDVQHV
jgi:hypothetical protein